MSGRQRGIEAAAPGPEKLTHLHSVGAEPSADEDNLGVGDVGGGSDIGSAQLDFEIVSSVTQCRRQSGRLRSSLREAAHDRNACKKGQSEGQRLDGHSLVGVELLDPVFGDPWVSRSVGSNVIGVGVATGDPDGTIGNQHGGGVVLRIEKMQIIVSAEALDL